MSEERLKMSTRLRPQPTQGARGYYYYNFFCERSERATRWEAPREKKPSRYPSEPAKRLIFSSTIRQRASETSVAIAYVCKQRRPATQAINTSLKLYLLAGKRIKFQTFSLFFF